MNCPIKSPENKEWLLEYSAGRLDGERTTLLEQHLELCPACARFVEEQRVVWNALGEWDAPRISADFNRRLYQKIDQAQASSWARRFLHPLWRPLLPVAAMCLLIVAGVVLRTPTTPVAPVNSRVEDVEPEQVERTLDDLQMLREMAPAPQQNSASQPM